MIKKRNSIAGIESCHAPLFKGEEMEVNVWLLQSGIVRLVKPNSVEDRDLARNCRHAVLKGTIELNEKGEGRQMIELRKPLSDFAIVMEAKLRLKDDERGPNGWREDNCSVDFLLARLEIEFREAKMAFDDCDPVNLAKECVDVANFAMMIYDRITNRQQEKEDERTAR